MMKTIYTYSTTSSRGTSSSFHPLHQRTEMGLFIKNNTWHDICYPLLLQYIADNIKELLLLTSASPPPPLFSHNYSATYTTTYRNTSAGIDGHQFKHMIYFSWSIPYSTISPLVICSVNVLYTQWWIKRYNNPKTYLILILKSNNKTIRQYLSSFPASQSWFPLFTLLPLQVTVHNFMRINLLALSSVKHKMESFSLSWRRQMNVSCSGEEILGQGSFWGTVPCPWEIPQVSHPNLPL